MALISHLFLTPEVQEQYKKKGEELPFIRSVFGRMMRFDLVPGFSPADHEKSFLSWDF